MTISTQASSVSFSGNASATVFPYTFLIPLAADLNVYYANAADVVTLLDPSVYSVSGLGNPAGGNVTYPLSGSPIASGTGLTISRVMPLTQEVDLTNQGGYYPDVVEGALDELTMICQQLKATQNLCLQLPPGSVATPSINAIVALFANGLKVGTRQILTAGSAATYTTAANVRQLVVRAWGAGGGGSGSGVGSTGGGNGGTTIFNSVNANGGTGGAAGGRGGTGGTGGTGTASFRLSGEPGMGPATYFATATTASAQGGSGGGQGGGYGGPQNGDGAAGIANTGGGGGGGGINTAIFATIAAANIAPGGGAGEYFELIINLPAATYTYTIGAAGAAGAAGSGGGQAGGAGGSGLIIVDEYY